MKWYPHHLGDYNGATQHLTVIQHGAYRLLLDYCYATEAPIPSDMALIARIFRLQRDSERRAFQTVLEAFFTTTSGGWRNKKADSEIAKSRRISEKRSKAGFAGAMTTNRITANAAPANAEQVLESPKSANAGILPGLTTTTTIEDQKKDQTHCPAAPDAGSAIAVKPANQKRGWAKLIALAALDYLNAKANKKFQPVDATLRFAIDRVLHDGATLADLCAVVDYQLKRVRDGKLDPMYTRPETVWNKTKFASYMGEVAAPPPVAPASPKRLQVFRIEDGVERVVTEVYVVATTSADTFNFEGYAKKCYSQFRAFIERGGNTTVIIDLEGSRRTFKTSELGAS